MALLLENASTTGDGVAIPRGLRRLTCTGTFDGATVTVESQARDGTWIPIVGAIYSAAAVRNIEIPDRGSTLRGAISGAGGSTSINLEID